MLNKIAEFFWRIAGWKSFVPAIIIYLVFVGGIMNYGAQRIIALSDKKTEILDKKFSYTPEEARTIIAGYGDEGRRFAANFELIADTLYPISYTFLFLMIMGWVFKSLSVYGVRVRYIHLMPFLVMAVDYGENACIITMLKTFPNFSDNVAWLSSLFTSLKWSLLAVETLIIAAAIWLLTFYRMSRGRLVRK